MERGEKMKIVFEIIGTFIVSLLLIAIIILCTMSFVYNWFPGVKFILTVASFAEWFGLVYLLSKTADTQD